MSVPARSPVRSREPSLVAADGRALARAVRVTGRVEPVFIEDIASMPAAIEAIARDGDIVITMGAGSVGGVAAALRERLGSAEPQTSGGLR